MMTNMDEQPPTSGSQPVVNCVAYKRKGKRIGDVAIDDISEALKIPGNFVWVGLHEPGEELLAKLQEEFGLHDLAVEDAHTAHQRTKIEAYGDSLFLVVQTVDIGEDGNLRFGETHVFLGASYLVTVRHGASPSYIPARRTCESNPELMAHGPGYGLYAVLDLIVDNYLPIVGAFREELQALDQKILGGSFDRDTIRRLYAMQRDLTRLRLAVTPLQDVLSQLVRLHQQLIDDELRAYFRDVLDHVVRVADSIGAMREMLAAAMNVNLALVTVGQNEVVKKLAGWAAILAAPTLVASWYGMNFEHMPEFDERWAYPILIGFVVVLCGGLYGLFKRARWL